MARSDKMYLIIVREGVKMLQKVFDAGAIDETEDADDSDFRQLTNKQFLEGYAVPIQFTIIDRRFDRLENYDDFR
jgi:hypothetical protein